VAAEENIDSGNLGDTNSGDLIVELAKRVEGVGPRKANALAEFLVNDWYAFLQSDKAQISSLKNSQGKQVFNDKLIDEILREKSEFAQFNDVRSAWIYCIGKDFLISQFSMLNTITLRNLDINPFLMKVLDFKSPRQILEFNLYQTVTRSIVTSWGSTVENLLIRCGAEKCVVEKNQRAGRRPDIKKMVGGKNFYIQVKSGPNTMNVDMVNSLNEVINEYKENYPDSGFLLGMTYGRKERISSQISANLNDFEQNALIGRKLWDFISEAQDFHLTLFQILDMSSKSITAKSFSEYLDEQLESLEREWKSDFQDKSIDESLEFYI
jgi:Type II restriction endonuclease EcoO109I